MPTSREQMAAQAIVGTTPTLPPIPYVPPPTDPRQMAGWYERFHAAMEDWREKVNQSLTSPVSETAQTQIPGP
jgi:hypothetical protein